MIELCNKCGNCDNCNAVHDATETAFEACMEMGELMSSLDVLRQSQTSSGKQKEILKLYIDFLCMMEREIEEMEFVS